MRKKFFYKTDAESQLGKAITAFFEKCNDVTKQAEEFVASCGASEYLESPLGMAGGVSFVIFPDNVTPDAAVWRKVNINGVGECYDVNVPDDFDPAKVRERDQDAQPLTIAEHIELARIDLPVCSEVELAAMMRPKIIVKDGKVVPQVMTETPSIFHSNKCWYIAVPFECEADDLQSIQEKTFYRRRLATLNKS